MLEPRSLNLEASGGFALLFAILASSVLLSIGLAIWNIAFREVLLSSFGRESQSAFYVADSAIECALYHDFIGTNVFATSTDSFISSPGRYVDYKTIDCGGLSSAKMSIYKPPLGDYQIDAKNATSTFTIKIGSGQAIVLVGKSDPGTGRSMTNIVSHGQNSSNAGDPTLVERGLRANY